jgi:serine phosphatase RsbU (regulator of sigma subunit)/PAS domain-containing protein
MIGNAVSDTPDRPLPDTDFAALKSRAAALRLAATLPSADSQTLLEAALAELDGAIENLGKTGTETGASGDVRSLRGLHSERRLLQSVFAAAPMPLYVVDHDGTVLRANPAACDLLGVGPGYATGRALTTLVDPAARAAVRSQLAAVGRTGKSARLKSGMLGSAGPIRCEMVIQPVSVRGDAERLLVAVGSEGALSPAGVVAGERLDGSDAPAVAAAARRLDLLAAASRLLLEGASVSESVLLQRCARLLSGDLANWVIIDVLRRGQLRRHYVAGPDDHESAGQAHAAAAVDPPPGSAPTQVIESGKALLVTHAEDDTLLGTSNDGMPLLSVLGAASLLCVPIAERTPPLGTITLANHFSNGQFGLADAALAEEIGTLLALAIAGRRTLRRRTEAAEALRASLLPPVLKPVPGVEIASAHMAPTRGREVGGDFYDAYPTPGGWGVAIGDVCGQGEDAAAATAAARHAIRVLAHWDADPAAVLRGANEIMLAEEFGGRFVTASAAHLSWHDSVLHVVLSSAGHPGPVLVKPDGRAQLVPGGGVPLGIFPDPEPATLELKLTSGDVLFFFTDGLAAARSPKATYFEDSLADSLAAIADKRAAEIVSDMRKLVLDFSAGRLVDDLTMLVLRVGRPPGR